MTNVSLLFATKNSVNIPPPNPPEKGDFQIDETLKINEKFL